MHSDIATTIFPQSTQVRISNSFQFFLLLRNKTVTFVTCRDLTVKCKIKIIEWSKDANRWIVNICERGWKWVDGQIQKSRKVRESGEVFYLWFEFALGSPVWKMVKIPNKKKNRLEFLLSFIFFIAPKILRKFLISLSAHFFLCCSRIWK